MRIQVFPNPEALGAEAARQAAERLKAAIQARGAANLILATGASQFEVLAHLIREPGVDWAKVTAFNLDDYPNMDDQHPASFRRYLRERFVSHVPLKTTHFVQGDAPNARAECRRLGELLARHPVAVALIGIGENGHLAFNDPPADFDTEEAFLIVKLNTACRRQQFGEGWFKSLKDVPATGITMSIRQILKAACLIVSVPDQRKAVAVQNAVEGKLTNRCPSSILRLHPDCRLFLDRNSASRLSLKWVKKVQGG
jgi:glucosamine-6-phosphate deaminase